MGDSYVGQADGDACPVFQGVRGAAGQGAPPGESAEPEGSVDRLSSRLVSPSAAVFTIFLRDDRLGARDRDRRLRAGVACDAAKLPVSPGGVRRTRKRGKRTSHRPRTVAAASRGVQLLPPGLPPAR